MSESNATPNGKAAETSTESSEEVKDPKAVLAKNQELLGKVKSQSEKARALEEELNRLKTEKLSGEGKKDELIEALKQQLSESKKKETQLGWNIVSSQVGMEAAKKGCVNVETLMKVVDFGSAAIDTESFSLAKDDINLILDKAVKDHPYLFKNEVKKTKDGGVSHSIDAPSDFNKMPKDKLLEAYRSLSMKQK